MKKRMFRECKIFNKTVIFRWISTLLLILGIYLVGFTVKAIFFKPDYAIKTESHYELNSDIQTKLPKAKTESLSEFSDNKVITDSVDVSYEEGDYIGVLIIPTLDYELPIYEGTDKSELKKGVGRYIGSALPGEYDNCVLSGHRDTVFSKLGDLQIGETIIVKSELGNYSYEVSKIRIVDKDDRTVIVTYDEAILTLTTCYPFNYIGFAPQRYIVSAKMIESKY